MFHLLQAILFFPKELIWIVLAYVEYSFLKKKVSFYPNIRSKIDVLLDRGYAYLPTENVNHETPNDRLTRFDDYPFEAYNDVTKCHVYFVLFKYDLETKCIQILTVTSHECDCDPYGTSDTDRDGNCCCDRNRYLTVYREVFINSLDGLKTLMGDVFSEEPSVAVYMLLNKEKPIIPYLIEDINKHDDRVYLKHSCSHDNLSLMFNDNKDLIKVERFESIYYEYYILSYYEIVSNLVQHFNLLYEDFKPCGVNSITNMATEEIITVDRKGEYIIFKISNEEIFRSLA
jgi:hypothetical protein